MDDHDLAFMVFAAANPHALEQVVALNDADALEAGEPLAALRKTMASQILSMQAESQGATIAQIVQGLLHRSPQADKDDHNYPVPGLEKYNRMRDFAASPEPSGIARPLSNSRKAKPRALQFCVQKHDATRLHYDFRLELNGTPQELGRSQRALLRSHRQTASGARGRSSP